MDYEAQKHKEWLDYFNKKGTKRTTCDVLVYCHPRKIKNRADHHQYDNFLEMVKERNFPTDGKINFFTVDLNTGINPYTDEETKPDFLTDGFGDKFINEHRGKFDLIILPDCGGEWVDLQGQSMHMDRTTFRWMKTFEENIPQLIILIKKIQTMLKNDGALYLGKILSSNLQDKIYEDFKNYTVTEKTYNAHKSKYIIIDNVVDLEKVDSSKK